VLLHLGTDRVLTCSHLGDCYLVNVWAWAWAGEHEQVSKIKNFGNISLTHGIEYCMTWRIILPHVQGWKMKMDTKKRWKIQIDEQKKDEHNLFIIKSYVSIQTLPIHNRKVCVNWNTISLSPRSMFPSGIGTIWDHTFPIPFQPVFYLNLVFQTSYV
jgi:hypothetical protein